MVLQCINQLPLSPHRPWLGLVTDETDLLVGSFKEVQNARQ